jgi:hypothetical protein
LEEGDACPAELKQGQAKSTRTQEINTAIGVLLLAGLIYFLRS